MLTLAQLRCLVAVADELNFRRAAARLNMTQPPLTRHVQALEQQVGTPLFDRDQRAVRLTPAGASLVRAARRILDQVVDATQDARKVAGGEAGAVTIAFTVASSYVFVPNLIVRIRQSFPALILNLRELTTPEQLIALRKEQIDFGLLRPPISLRGVQSRRVHRETMVVALPRRHALASSPVVELGEIITDTLITYPPVEGPYLHGLVMGLFHAAGLSPANVQHITQTHSILALVEAELGVAIVPRVAERVAPPGVVLVQLAGSQNVNVDLHLAWRTNSANPACRAVLKLMG
jgi:DNA-binding transcriptional LysR family regulator